jgi:hypothetical protein
METFPVPLKSTVIWNKAEFKTQNLTYYAYTNYVNVLILGPKTYFIPKNIWNNTTILQNE